MADAQAPINPSPSQKAKGSSRWWALALVLVVIALVVWAWGKREMNPAPAPTPPPAGTNSPEPLSADASIDAAVNELIDNENPEAADSTLTGENDADTLSESLGEGQL